MEMDRIASFFSGWEETLIWSCLQGCMGRAVVDDEQNPTAAQIIVGDFCFLAGRPSAVLLQTLWAPLIIPRTADWEPLIENLWGGRLQKGLRYAMKKEPDAFSREKLERLALLPNARYEMRLFDQALYRQAISENWSKDLCGQFDDDADFSRRGLGIGALHNGRLVAGAASYTLYHGGIEIEIDTKPEYRRQGLATACGAALILTCLHRGLYPSWDAHDLRSVALAEKLGYHLDSPYTVYQQR